MHTLTELDDLPWHQVAAPFGESAISDPHFNDGYYFAAYDPAGSTYLFMGMRVHVNNNVIDGYAGMVHGTRQLSIRFSRELRGRLETAVGPLTITFSEPMKRMRLVLDENPTGLTFGLEWTATAPPFLEARHHTHRYGRVTNDLLRYTQTGRATGSVVLPGGLDVECRRWYACRDHSWGLRQMMGPNDRPKGTVREPGDPRALRLWVPFEVGDHAGFFHLHEDIAGRQLDFEGTIWPLDGTGPITLVEARHAIEYGPGRRLSRAQFALTDEHGRIREYTAVPVLPPAHPMGFGYSRGWEDGGNPGVWRGPFHQETSDWEVGDIAAGAGLPLGGTEFVSALEFEGSRGMAHVEHMRYDAG